LIDDYLAYSAKDLKLFYSSSFIAQELWVSLIEKAWAKIHGGYKNIKKGLSTSAFEALTGAFTRKISIGICQDKKRRKKIRKILEDSKEYLICAGTKNVFSQLFNKNLKEAHEYTVVKIKNDIIEL
jgi:hypothetical protein